MMHDASQRAISMAKLEPQRFQVYTERQLDKIDAIRSLSAEQRFSMRVVAKVLPFRVNQYVIDELIDWSNVPADPIFQLTFPQQGMLDDEDFNLVADALKREDNVALAQAVTQVRQKLNPHPAGQQDLNRPMIDDEAMNGMQHKYKETLLFFPSQGQTCHSYCTFCFRWAQFIGDKTLRFSSNQSEQLQRYLKKHREISDILITGGDPMVMKTRHLSDYLTPLLAPEFSHIKTIRIGTKSLSFWPQRYVSDADADDLLRLFEKLVKAGKHVAIMAHYNHWQEMETDMARIAASRIRATGAVIRTQAPLLAHINDDPEVWNRMWRTQVNRGMIPYYMFVERDTGARHYFEVPLARAWEIYRDAMKSVAGTCRTARGPSMSACPGKIEIQGVSEINGEKVFVLRFIQGRNPEWVQRPFFAKYDPDATWLDHLKPAFGEKEFFFEQEFNQMVNEKLKQTGNA